MFSNTAYEAMYQYLGLELHAKFIEVITSQKVFVGVILLIFGVMFFLTTVQFFSRYLPGVLVTRKLIPLSKYFKIVACLFLGLALLRVGSHTSVKRFNGESWYRNPYIHGQIRSVAPEYRVSAVFDILSRSAEEISALIARVIDQVFESSHSQLDAPNFFFKAIMYGGAATIDDPDLKNTVKFYTEECFDRIIPLMKDLSKASKLDLFFTSDADIDQKLSPMVIQNHERVPYSCLDLKNDIRRRLTDYALKKSGKFSTILSQTVSSRVGLNTERFINYYTSSALVNHYLDNHEGPMGIHKNSQIPTTGGRVLQYLNRIFSVDGFLGILGGRDLQGAALAASRSQEFSENLARAPHVAGFIKMVLIAIFPWLLFAVVAGYWRVLVYWFLIYFSVLLWTPIWTLLYHVMVGISVSTEVMQAFGRLSDGISLYSSELIGSRLYHMFAVYSWLQLLTGTLFTGMLLYFLKPSLMDTDQDSMPDFVDNSTRAVSSGTKAAGALL